MMRLGVYVASVFCGVLLLFSLCVAAPMMVEKNLFAQDRKPPPPESATPAVQSNKPGPSHNAIQLDGIIIHGDSRKALLRYKGQVPGAEKKKDRSPYVTVREGQRFGDYQVVKIESKSVSLEKDGQVFVISLFSDGKVVTPLPAAAAVPPQPRPARPPQPGHPPEMPGGRMMPAQPPMPEGAEGAGHATMAAPGADSGTVGPGTPTESPPAQPQPDEEPQEEEEEVAEESDQ